MTDKFRLDLGDGFHLEGPQPNNESHSYPPKQIPQWLDRLYMPLRWLDQRFSESGWLTLITIFIILTLLEYLFGPFSIGCGQLFSSQCY
jgi:hypothetical protein